MPVEYRRALKEMKAKPTPSRKSRSERNYNEEFSTVIASAAKQSIRPQAKHGLLRRFAPRNDGKWRASNEDEVRMQGRQG